MSFFIVFRDVLKENKQLTVPVLDALSNLILKPELLTEVCMLEYIFLC